MATPLSAVKGLSNQVIETLFAFVFLPRLKSCFLMRVSISDFGPLFLLIIDFWAKSLLISDFGAKILLISGFWAKILLISNFRGTPLGPSLMTWLRCAVDC